MSSMATREVVEKWLSQVHEDISAAECMYRGGHWLYVGFLCHQAIEKALKAYYIATHDDDPRYTHSHTILIADCGLTDKFSPEQLRFIDMMVPMYIRARYPEYKRAVAQTLDKKICKDILTRTTEITSWLEQLLQGSRQ